MRQGRTRGAQLHSRPPFPPPPPRWRPLPPPPPKHKIMELTQSITDQALLDAQLELWRNTFAYIKSMALKAALDLRIADTIDHHGGAATIPQIVAKVTLHPSKIPCLRRLMRVLSVSSVFTVQHAAADDDGACGEPLYSLTSASRLLVGSENLVSITAMLLHPLLVTPFLQLGTWFQHELLDPCIFKQTHSETLWELAGHDAAFDALINDGMVSDSRFIMDIAVKERDEVFHGIRSLVDVGGGLGAAAQAISEAFPPPPPPPVPLLPPPHQPAAELGLCLPLRCIVNPITGDPPQQHAAPGFPSTHASIAPILPPRRRMAPSTSSSNEGDGSSSCRPFP